jgi:2-C-methyl-D-erythritol 2,4-cyclodiphosphate synthase
MTFVGIGYDVHRLMHERKLILGGVTIPHPTGLDGHSDADVLMHAVCDAVLGALGQGDIHAGRARRARSFCRRPPGR